MEKETLHRIDSLVTDWKQVDALLQQGTFDYDLFKSAFEGTFVLLSPLSCVMTIDKELMHLIALVARFAYSRMPDPGKQYTACVIMTERLLWHCALRPTVYIEPVTHVTVYSLESRLELELDFTDVDASVDLLCNNLDR